MVGELPESLGVAEVQVVDPFRGGMADWCGETVEFYLHAPGVGVCGLVEYCGDGEAEVVFGFSRVELLAVCYFFHE